MDFNLQDECLVKLQMLVGEVIILGSKDIFVAQSINAGDFQIRLFVAISNAGTTLLFQT